MIDHEVKREICATSVLFYKDKILLLFDQNYKHYVLPQGHTRKNEHPSETAIREAKEETGFTNLKLIKKLGQYQYHFCKDEKLIYKKIIVYLIEILNQKKVKKMVSQRENFINRFFLPTKAIEKLQWPQDKKQLEKL